MEGFLRYFLPAYFVVFICLAFLWRSARVWKATGRNPYRIGWSESAHDYIGRTFAVLVVLTAAMVAIYLFLPAAYAYLMPMLWLSSPALIWTGLACLIFGLIWMVAAQETMGASWRIGVDSDVRTALVTHGMFSLSRNPIFLGMRIMLLGLFLTLPNALSFAIALLGDTLIQVQTRLEEQHMFNLHGEVYRDYTRRTRRWI